MSAYTDLWKLRLADFKQLKVRFNLNYILESMKLYVGFIQKPFEILKNKSKLINVYWTQNIHVDFPKKLCG